MIFLSLLRENVMSGSLHALTSFWDEKQQNRLLTHEAKEHLFEEEVFAKC